MTFSINILVILYHPHTRRHTRQEATLTLSMSILPSNPNYHKVPNDKWISPIVPQVRMDVFQLYRTYMERISALTTSLIWQNKDSICHIIECRSRIKEGVLNQKVWSRKNVSYYGGCRITSVVRMRLDCRHIYVSDTNRKPTKFLLYIYIYIHHVLLTTATINWGQDN